MKSISMLVIILLTDSIIALTCLRVGRVLLFFPTAKMRKVGSRVMPIKLDARAELQTSKTARSYFKRTLASGNTTAIKFKMTLNFLSARNSFSYADALVVLKNVKVFVGRQAKKNFGKFVVAGKNFIWR